MTRGTRFWRCGAWRVQARCDCANVCCFKPLWNPGFCATARQQTTVAGEATSACYAPPQSTLALPPPASPSPHPSLSASHLRVTHSEGLSLQAQVRVKLERGAAALDGDRDGHGAVRPNCQLALHRLQCKEGGKQDVKVMMMTLRVGIS
jgi:hypothetical protein